MMQRADDMKLVRITGGCDDSIFTQLENIEKATIADGWSANSFRSEAEKDNGYVLCIMDGDCIATLLTGYYATGEGDITNAAVLPQYRRKGLAMRLIDEFQELLPDDAEKIFLEVRESNLPAIELYKKCGFESISLRRNFYTNPRENAIVMMKEVL